MPRYDFRNKETGEIIEVTLKIAERDQYMQDNPNLEPYITSPPSMGDPVRLGIRKDKGFKEVLQKIHSRSPGSTLNTTADI